MGVTKELCEHVYFCSNMEQALHRTDGRMDRMFDVHLQNTKVFDNHPQIYMVSENLSQMYIVSDSHSRMCMVSDGPVNMCMVPIVTYICAWCPIDAQKCACTWSLW